MISKRILTFIFLFFIFLLQPFFEDMGHTQIARILRAGGATVTNPALARTLCQAAADADVDTLSTVGKRDDQVISLLL